MGISPVREATADDRAAVRAAAERFCKRHSIDYDPDPEWGGPEAAIEYRIEYGGELGDKDAYIRKLWTACYCRALGFRRADRNITIAHGYVGYSCD